MDLSTILWFLLAALVTWFTMSVISKIERATGRMEGYRTGFTDGIEQAYLRMSQAGFKIGVGEVTIEPALSSTDEQLVWKLRSGDRILFIGPFREAYEKAVVMSGNEGESR